MSFRKDMSSSNHIPGFFFKKNWRLAIRWQISPGEQRCGLCCLFVWPDATLKVVCAGFWAFGKGARWWNQSKKKFLFVLCSFPLCFLLFLFCCGPLSVVFLLLLFSAVFFALPVRPFLCVCWSCCLVAVVFGRGKYNFLVLRFLFALFLCCCFFFRADLYVAILFCRFLHFVCCVVSAGCVFSLVFSLCCGCVWHYICNALVRCPPATFVLFFFVLWPAGFGGVVFALAVPPPVIRPKCGSSVPMRALPCLLPVFPYIKFPHWVHPNHSRTSVSFWSCVCAFCCGCV